jgi:Transposase and inactivated derivatives
MVLDNGAFHKAKVLNIPDNIKLVFLPPYSPELNPAERMWARLKRPFTNKILHSLEQVSLFLDDAVNDISNVSVISTCAYPYIFLTRSGMKNKSYWYKSSIHFHIQTAPSAIKIIFLRFKHSV